MSNVTNSQISQFAEALRACGKRMGGGKYGLDSSLLRNLVRGQRNVAERFVQLHLFAAASQPGLLQPAVLIAGAYAAEFADTSLLQQVVARAEELGATDVLNAIAAH